VNRISCTLLHLASFRTMTELQPLFKAKAPEAFTAEERQRDREVCDRALDLRNQYMRLHAWMIQDRGCEGTLMSSYYSAPSLLRQIKAAYGGDAGVNPVGRKTPDAPLAPAEKRPPSL